MWFDPKLVAWDVAKRWLPYVLLTLLVALLTIAVWFLYHVWWGRLT